MATIETIRPGEALKGTQHEARISGRKDFGRILHDKLAAGELSFSQHALDRLNSRDITLTASDLQRLGTAVSLAAAKGARESLVLLDDLALVVSVTNRTVITALRGTEKQERVFTGIDSAVIV